MPLSYYILDDESKHNNILALVGKPKQSIAYLSTIGWLTGWWYISKWICLHNNTHLLPFPSPLSPPPSPPPHNHEVSKIPSV
jgi:hypothetical protein